MSKMSFLWSVVVLSLFLIAPSLVSAEKYSMVEIQVSNDNELKTLQNLGLPLDCCLKTYAKSGYIFTVPLNQSDLALLNKEGVNYKVAIEDAAEYYVKRAQTDDSEKAETTRKSLGTSMQYGSKGGFYTVAEIGTTLDALYDLYGSKNLITKKQSIGKTWEGRDIYVVKISDNASLDESGSEQQVLYTALTHAREPGGMMAVFYFMYYLLENYETSQRVRSIVDNREIFFIPCVNPDGYDYNSYGGMHRKNKNPSGTVDLNRNFGPTNLWDYPNGGSSTSSSSETYRGKSAFSEPETAAYRDFVNGKNIKTALNYHTYSNLLIYPWGIKDEIAHPTFKTMGIEMTKINGYSYGTAEGLLYAVRGVSDDFLWQEHGTFAVTIEAGGYSDGFWPTKTRIFPLAEENLEANLLLAEYAGQVKK